MNKDGVPRQEFEDFSDSYLLIVPDNVDGNNNIPDHDRNNLYTMTFTEFMECYRNVLYSPPSRQFSTQTNNCTVTYAECSVQNVPAVTSQYSQAFPEVESFSVQVFPGMVSQSIQASREMNSNSCQACTAMTSQSQQTRVVERSECATQVGCASVECSSTQTEVTSISSTETQTDETDSDVVYDDVEEIVMSTQDFGAVSLVLDRDDCIIRGVSISTQCDLPLTGKVKYQTTETSSQTPKLQLSVVGTQSDEHKSPVASLEAEKETNSIGVQCSSDASSEGYVYSYDVVKALATVTDRVKNLRLTDFLEPHDDIQLMNNPIVYCSAYVKLIYEFADDCKAPLPVFRELTKRVIFHLLSLMRQLSLALPSEESDMIAQDGRNLKQVRKTSQWFFKPWSTKSSKNRIETMKCSESVRKKHIHHKSTFKNHFSPTDDLRNKLNHKKGFSDPVYRMHDKDRRDYHRCRRSPSPERSRHRENPTVYQHALSPIRTSRTDHYQLGGRKKRSASEESSLNLSPEGQPSFTLWQPRRKRTYSKDLESYARFQRTYQDKAPFDRSPLLEKPDFYRRKRATSEESTMCHSPDRVGRSRGKENSRNLNSLSTPFHEDPRPQRREVSEESIIYPSSEDLLSLLSPKKSGDSRRKYDHKKKTNSTESVIYVSPEERQSTDSEEIRNKRKISREFSLHRSSRSPSSSKRLKFRNGSSTSDVSSVGSADGERRRKTSPSTKNPSSSTGVPRSRSSTSLLVPAEAPKHVVINNITTSVTSSNIPCHIAQNHQQQQSLVFPHHPASNPYQQQPVSLYSHQPPPIQYCATQPVPPSPEQQAYMRQQQLFSAFPPYQYQQHQHTAYYNNINNR